MSKDYKHNGKGQLANSKGGLRVKKDTESGKFVDVKGGRSFKGIRQEALDKLGSTLNKLAKYDKQ